MICKVMMLAGGLTGLMSARASVSLGRLLLVVLTGLTLLTVSGTELWDAHVSFHANDGSGTMADEVWTVDRENNYEHALPTCRFTRSGYTFAGWKAFDTCTYWGGTDYRDDGEIRYGYTGTYAAGYMYQAACGHLWLEATWRANGNVEWQRARTLRGAWGEGCGGSAEGTCELKCGKMNRKGYAKISLKVTKFDGKKVNYGSGRVYVKDGGTVTVRLKNTYAVTIQPDGGFFGEPIYGSIRPACSPNAVWDTSVGGALSGTHHLSIFEWPDTEIALLKAVGLWTQYQGGMCSYFEDYDWMAFTASGNRWIFPASDYSRVPKVTYNAKTGLFKGSLKVTFGPYCLANAAGQKKQPRGKKVSLKFRGGYVGGEILGTAAYRAISTSLYGE